MDSPNLLFYYLPVEGKVKAGRGSLGFGWSWIPFLMASPAWPPTPQPGAGSLPQSSP